MHVLKTSTTKTAILSLQLAAFVLLSLGAGAQTPSDASTSSDDEMSLLPADDDRATDSVDGTAWTRDSSGIEDAIAAPAGTVSEMGDPDSVDGTASVAPPAPTDSVDGTADAAPVAPVVDSVDGTARIGDCERTGSVDGTAIEGDCASAEMIEVPASGNAAPTRNDGW